MSALAACHPALQGGSSGGGGSGGSSGSGGPGCSDSSASSASTGSGGSGGASPGRAFKLVGAYWTGSAEAVERIDPVTGAGTFLGNLGDLHWWSNQLVLDADATHVYAVGLPAQSGPPTLYVLDLASGASTQTPIAHSYTLGGVTDDGRVIGVYWSGAAEAVDLIDSASGRARSSVTSATSCGGPTSSAMIATPVSSTPSAMIRPACISSTASLSIRT